MEKAGQSQFGRSYSSSDSVARFENRHGLTGTRDRNASGETIGPRADHNGIIRFRVSKILGAVFIPLSPEENLSGFNPQLK